MKRDDLFKGSPGTRLLAMGNEAIVRGAIEAGVQLVTGYPGTPSSEIVDTAIEAARELGFQAYWSVNEKVAFDVATGAVFSGARALVSCKHVGINVLADSLMQINHIDIPGGLVIVSVDDPSGSSSNNEQDNRHYAKFAEIPALEPSNLDEAREMTKQAFVISEELQLPVLLRSVARLSHMTADMTLGPIDQSRRDSRFDGSRVYTPFPPLIPHRRLREKMRRAPQVLASYDWNRYEGTGKEKLGIAASGFTYNYAREGVDALGLNAEVALLKVGTPHPPPRDLIRRLLAHVEAVLVLEDVNSFLEEILREEAHELSRSVRILGRKSGTLPDSGETQIDSVIDAVRSVHARFSISTSSTKTVTMSNMSESTSPSQREGAEVTPALPRRESTFCVGCPHRATFYALKEAMQRAGLEDPIVVGDIGCYTLGFNAPFRVLQTMTSMGASMGTALALAQFNPSRQVIAVIGDSTFYHAGMPGVLQISQHKAPVLVLVMDNSVTAMTGQQSHPGTWHSGDRLSTIPIEDIVQAFKIPTVRVVSSWNPQRLSAELNEVLKTRGPAVVISRGACALLPERRERVHGTMAVNASLCDGCLRCIREFGCPAFLIDDDGSLRVTIDETQCDGCAACLRTCPAGAFYAKKSSERKLRQFQEDLYDRHV